MAADPEITKEFLEETLKTKVEKFVVNTGSNLGDGYTCVLYSVDVWIKGSDEPLPILIKCFPSNPLRQKMLDHSETFTNELRMYDTVIPDLEKFQEEAGTKFRLPFAPFIAGQEVPVEKRNGAARLRENYIVMTDLRKQGGFSLRDRFEGLDLDHFKLVIEGQATLHAASWAYKQQKGQKLRELYPVLAGVGFANMFEIFMSDYLRTIEKEIEVFKDEPRIQDGLRHLQAVAVPAAKLYFNVPLKEDEKHFTMDTVVRKPQRTVENEEPWEVLRHGDCWNNNLLFRYDPITGKPAEVVFIDLQNSMEADLFGDLCYSLFVNATQDICERFSVPSLPGWSWEEFHRRFHRAQVFGMAVGVVGLPVVLKHVDEMKDLEKLSTSEDGVGDDESMRELTGAIMGANVESPMVMARLRRVLEDGIDAGVI